MKPDERLEGFLDHLFAWLWFWCTTAVIRNVARLIAFPTVARLRVVCEHVFSQYSEMWLVCRYTQHDQIRVQTVDNMSILCQQGVQMVVEVAKSDGIHEENIPRGSTCKEGEAPLT